MDFFTGETLQLLIEKDKKKSEGLLPELIKRLILSSSPSVSNIRMPGLEDIWAPGFDGIVNCKEATTYVADGISVWECGTNVDSLKKINEDYEKRTRNSLGINKASTTFYFVVPKIWAYNNQGMPISKWESEHKNGWREVCVYDASVLSDWIKSEPAVCAWLIEQYGENKHTDFATVEGAWETFSNLTNPPLSHSMFLEGRQNETADFQNKCKQKMCRIRSAYFMDAYGFCLSSLIQNKEMSHQVIVVNNEDTYLELTRFLKGKTFLLSFPFSGKVSDCNATIVCYSKEATSYGDMIELPALWKTQYTKALRDMGLSDTQASECYLFTHGNLLSLVRRIPGNAASSRPKWADAPDIELLYPLVFMHQFSTTNDLEKTVVSDIAGVAYAQLESKYESFLRMEDAPLKKVGDFYYLVNFEEAWRTLQVDASDVMSSKMQDTIITLLSACEKNNEFQSQPLESIIRRLLYNYIYFSETGSEQKVIDDRVIAIFECAKTSISSSVVLKSLADLAEASPTETMSFIESQLINGVVNQAFSESNSWSGSYHYVLWALDKLVQYEESAIRACRVLCGLCLVPSEYHTGNSPKESLLNALCLWDDHSAIKLDEKTRIAIKLIDDNSVFGVPFAIELISKESVFRGVRIGEKERRFGGITPEGFRQARGSIGSKIIGTSIQENRADWLGKLLDVYWCVPSAVLSSAAELLLRASFCPKEKVHLILQLRRHLFYNEKNDRENRIRWDEALEKWLNYLTTEDPTSQEGWRFYKYHETPFPELLSDDIKTDYIKRLELAEEIRQKTFADVRSKFGSDAIFRLAKCMEDSWAWGVFLGKNLVDGEYNSIAELASSSNKLQLLAGLVSTVDLPIATEIFEILPKEERESLLPLLHRDDIDDWLVSQDLKHRYWQNKQMVKYTDRTYYNLLKYNPCGILPFFYDKERESEAFIKLIEVLRAIADHNSCSDPGMLTHIVKQFDIYHYSDEWAKLCLNLYEKASFSGIYGFYPACLQTYFFRHPEKMLEKYHDDPSAFYKHFHYDYSLPDAAFDDYASFIAWSDYIFNAATQEPHFISSLGTILGRAMKGKDGIFPHEFVRMALEKYSNDVLTHDVAVGWLNSRGFRTVTDGLNEKRIEERYREYARSMELEYPQTAKILSIIADDYGWEAKRDQLDAELFPQ